eukprot:CFRG8225T1
MGGGDLNLKKSWHPVRLDNVEKVWKAEQKDKHERERIAQLIREKEEERQREELANQAVSAGHAKVGSQRLEWMYAGASTTNKTHTGDEYLLGKRIEKLPGQDEDAEAERAALTAIPGLGAGTSSTGTTTDLAAKIREDPMYLIKKRQKDQVMEIRNNPVKMQQLQQLLGGMKDKKHKKDKKQKKDKKHKRTKHRDDRDAISGVNSEPELTPPPSTSSHSARKHKNSDSSTLSQRNMRNDRENKIMPTRARARTRSRSPDRHRNRKYHDQSRGSEGHRTVGSMPRRSAGEQNRKKVTESRKPGTSAERTDTKLKHGGDHSRTRTQSHLHSHSRSRRSRSTSRSKSRSRSRSRSPVQTSSESRRRYRSPASSTNGRDDTKALPRYRRHSRSPARSNKTKSLPRASPSTTASHDGNPRPETSRGNHGNARTQNAKIHTRSSIDPAEKARKLAEMQANASIVETERLERITDGHRIQKEEDEKEKLAREKDHSADKRAGFLEKMERDATVGVNSLEDRINRNRAFSQRTNAALGKKFTAK